MPRQDEASVMRSDALASISERCKWAIESIDRDKPDKARRLTEEAKALTDELYRIEVAELEVKR